MRGAGTASSPHGITTLLLAANALCRVVGQLAIPLLSSHLPVVRNEAPVQNRQQFKHGGTRSPSVDVLRLHTFGRHTPTSLSLFSAPNGAYRPQST